MNENEKNTKKKYILAGVLILVLIVILPGSLIYYQQHSFTTKQWIEDTRHRARMVDDLLSDYDLIGMNEAEITQLLGENDNDYGYFQAENRFVYCLGPEQGFLSGFDSEWLILDFTDGKVSRYSIDID